MKNRSHRYDINKPSSRYGQKYSKPLQYHDILHYKPCNKKGDDIARQLFFFYPRSTYQPLKPVKGINLLNKCI